MEELGTLSRRSLEGSARFVVHFPPAPSLSQKCSLNKPTWLTQRKTFLKKGFSVKWYCIWKMLALELVGVFVISTSILNLKVYSVMKMSDAIIFLHKKQKILMYCGLLTFFVNIRRGHRHLFRKVFKHGLNFKHMSNRSVCISSLFH